MDRTKNIPMTYHDIILQLTQRISNNFDKVYHSVEIVTVDKQKFPGVSIGNEWVNLSPTDTNEILYLRRNGDDEVYSEEPQGSCSKAYKMRSPLRLVYFNAHDANSDQVLFKLMQSVLVNHTKIVRIIRDKYRLQRDESSGSYEFGPQSVYLAIDLYVTWILQPDICEQDFCIDIENPYCLTS